MSVAEAVAERDRVLDEVIAKMQARGTYTPAMQIIARWARTGREFSLNDIRGELTAAGVDVSKGLGGITIAAIKTGLIRKVRDETSTSKTTNGKKIGVYIGAPAAARGLSSLIPTAPRRGEVVEVPVHRDHGRFTSPTSAPAPDALFDLPEGSA